METKVQSMVAKAMENIAGLHMFRGNGLSVERMTAKKDIDAMIGRLSLFLGEASDVVGDIRKAQLYGVFQDGEPVFRILTVPSMGMVFTAGPVSYAQSYLKRPVVQLRSFTSRDFMEIILNELLTVDAKSKDRVFPDATKETVHCMVRYGE